MFYTFDQQMLIIGCCSNTAISDGTGAFRNFIFWIDERTILVVIYGGGPDVSSTDGNHVASQGNSTSSRHWTFCFHAVFFALLFSSFLHFSQYLGFVSEFAYQY